MRLSPPFRGGGIAASLLVLMLSAWPNRAASQNPSAPSPPTEKSTTASRTNGVPRGEQLARLYCQTCHLFPTPDLLDQRTWMTGTLRRMAPMMGVARLNFDHRPDGKILKESNLFPAAPILPESDWVAIWNYYLNAAPETANPQDPRDQIQPVTRRFDVEALGASEMAPAITLVKVDSVAHRVMLGDAAQRALHVLDARGRRQSSLSVPSAPVSWTAAGTNLYLTVIGDVFPSDVASGQVLALQPTSGGYRSRPLLTELKRPVDVTVSDLNADGRHDLIVSQFGNYLGRLSWFETGAGAAPEEHVLLANPGAIRATVQDLDRDGRADLVALMAQAREGLYLFRQDGTGGFTNQPLIQFPPAFGSTYFEWADFDNDGLPDLLLSNGDNGEYASPFKRYHGLRIYRNHGHFDFRKTWFYPLNGAFKALARDFDGDGDLDMVAISFFPDYQRSPEESFVYLENLGGMKFAASTIAQGTDGRWLTLDAGDLDGDGDLDVVLGAFNEGPRATPVPQAVEQKWRTQPVAALLLRNTTVH
jgi:hypothetical protein